VAGLALVLALGGGTLAACSDDETEPTTTDGTTAGTAPAQDAGEAVERFNEPTAPIAVTVGQEFEIALLTGNASEGYTWTIESIDPDGVITLVESRPSAIPGESEPDLTDGAGENVFLFTADAAGTATITLNQAQNYPGGSVKVPERTITVEVSE
jgi:predicted secreted protein